MVDNMPAKYVSLAKRSQWVLRVGGADESTISQALGGELPAINRCVFAGDWAVLRLGPDEFWLDGPEGQAPALPAGGLGLVDISERQARFVLEGPGVEGVLASGCPLDLAPSAFSVGKASRTIFFKIEILLWRQADTRFRVECTRSFAPYLEEMVALAIRDCAAEA